MIFSRLPIWVAVLAVSLAGYWDSAAKSAELQYPLSVAVAENGDVYLADRDVPGIWKLAGEQMSMYFEGSKKFRTVMNAVRCVGFDNEGRLLAGDSATRNVYRFDESGQPIPITTVDGGFGQIGIPMDVAVNSSGDVFVSDLEIQRIVKVPKDGDQPEEVAQIAGCRGLFMDSEDNLWVISTTSDQLHRIAPSGEVEVIVKGRPFEFPHTVVVDDEGTAYVCDGYAKTIWRVVPGEAPAKWSSGEPLDNPVGLDIHNNVIYVADPRAKAVFRADSEGNLTKLPFTVATE